MVIGDISGKGAGEQIGVEGGDGTDQTSNDHNGPGGVDVLVTGNDKFKRAVHRSADFRASGQDLLDNRVGDALDEGTDDAADHNPQGRGVHRADLEGDGQRACAANVHTPRKERATDNCRENGAARVGASLLDVDELLGHDEVKNEEGGICACDGEQVHLQQIKVVLATESGSVCRWFDDVCALEHETKEGADEDGHDREGDALFEKLRLLFLLILGRMMLGHVEIENSSLV